MVGAGACAGTPTVPQCLAAPQGPANIEAIALLVELGADVDATLAQRSLETPLHIAARCGRLDILERLLKCPQARAGARGGWLGPLDEPACLLRSFGFLDASAEMHAWRLHGLQLRLTDSAAVPGTQRLALSPTPRAPPPCLQLPVFHLAAAPPCRADQRDMPHQGRLHRPALRGRLWADARAGRARSGGLPGGQQGQRAQHAHAPGSRWGRAGRAASECVGSDAAALPAAPPLHSACCARLRCTCAPFRWMLWSRCSSSLSLCYSLCLSTLSPSVHSPTPQAAASWTPWLRWQSWVQT